MNGAITKTACGFKAWAWDKSIFLDCKISYHATWQEAFDHLRMIGAEIITDESEVKK